MAIFKKTRVGSKLVKQIALAAAMCVGTVAHAGVLDFQQDPGFPFIFSGTETQFGDYWMLALDNAGAGDMTGMLINGMDQADVCTGSDLKCPQNNTSTYYAALADSYFVVGMNSMENFRLGSFSASFIGTGNPLYTSGLIVLQGFDANFNAIASATQQISVPGAASPTGAYNFQTFTPGAAFNQQVAAVRFLPYACNTAGQCSRGVNAANFAFDNITFVPEPATFGLIGLGLLGMGAARRKKRAA